MLFENIPVVGIPMTLIVRRNIKCLSMSATDMKQTNRYVLSGHGWYTKVLTITTYCTEEFNCNIVIEHNTHC